MEIEVRMLLLAVLTAILACKHCIHCRPKGNAETQIPVNNTVNPVHRRNACYMGCSNDNTPICGRSLVVTTYVKREITDHDDSLNDDEEGGPHLDKILGGSYATYGEIPWIVSIQYNSLTICGGAIINEFWIITAAHCMYHRVRIRFKITVGDHRRWYKDDYEVSFLPDKIIIHEGFSRTQQGFDIALVKVKAKKTTGRGILFNNYVQPICLPSAAEEPALGTPLLFAGWGYTTKNLNVSQSQILKKTIMPVISMDTCRNLYTNVQSASSIFCAGYVHGDNDMCSGDSGGPAVSKLGESYILYGIGSSSSGCTPPNYPSLFENVAKHRDWIDTNIKLNSKVNETVMPVRNFYVDFVPLPDK